MCAIGTKYLELAKERGMIIPYSQYDTYGMIQHFLGEKSFDPCAGHLFCSAEKYILPGVQKLCSTRTMMFLYEKNSPYVNLRCILYPDTKSYIVRKKNRSIISIEKPRKTRIALVSERDCTSERRMAVMTPRHSLSWPQLIAEASPTSGRARASSGAV